MATLTVEEAQKLVREAVDEFPTRRNPVKDGVCQYDAYGCHCIVGEVLKRAGLPFPQANVSFPGEHQLLYDDALSIYEELITPAAMVWLGRIQRLFDGSQWPREWKVALESAEQLGMFSSV